MWSIEWSLMDQVERRVLCQGTVTDYPSPETALLKVLLHMAATITSELAGLEQPAPWALKLNLVVTQRE